MSCSSLCMPTEELSECLHLCAFFFGFSVFDSPFSSLKCRHLFFLQAKALLKDGKLPVSQEEAGKIGALLAQAEMGDSVEDQVRDNHSMLCYPQYFNDWDVGTARAIAQEHSQLKGQSVSSHCQRSIVAILSVTAYQRTS